MTDPVTPVVACFALVLASNGAGPTNILSGYPTRAAAEAAMIAAEPPPCIDPPNALVSVCQGLFGNGRLKNFRDIRIIPAPAKDCVTLLANRSDDHAR